MRPARLILMVTTVAAVALAGALSAQQAKPAKPMQIEKVKDLRAERMRRRLRRRWHAARGGRRGRPRHTGRIKYLLNTHHHTDHAGGLRHSAPPSLNDRNRFVVTPQLADGSEHQVCRGTEQEEHHLEN